jgi:hypothetical protein
MAWYGEDKIGTVSLKEQDEQSWGGIPAVFARLMAPIDQQRHEEAVFTRLIIID